MSYQVLARKWRPKKFQELIGQSHVTRSLQNAIANHKIGHAYMMVGTRGVGKTSVARIFAKAIRCENITADINACGECEACLDFDTDTSMNVIEIDGASNNSVDNIRDLISNVHYLPTKGKYKVYIIDEVHMLSTNAFNALLKTLEEPPAHVVFIFATTEVQKLLGTVLSRCQRFDFRNVPVETLAAHVKHISNAEGIKFENEELITQLATLGRGSVRDTLSLLDQVLTFSQDNFITEEVFTTSLGVAGPSAITELKNYVLKGDAENVGKLYNKFLYENIPAKNIASALLDDVYAMILQKSEYSQAELIWIYETLAKETNWVFSSITPDKAFEVLLYKATLRRSFFNKTLSSGGAQVSSPAAEKKTVEASAPVAKVEVVAETVVIEEMSVADKLKQYMAEAAENLQVAEVKEEVKPSPVASAKKEETPETAAPTGPLTWEGFLDDLSRRAPASASNLEQGNILSPLKLDADRLSIELGFGYSGQVFMDYLSEAEVFQKLLVNLSQYFKLPKENIKIDFKQVSSGEEFITQAVIREQRANESMQEKIESFKSNPLLKEAEKIFNSKVDKVILTEKK